MKEVMEKVDKQVGRAVERLGSEGSQKEEGFDGLDAIKHIADGRTCLSIKGGLCPCQKEGVRSLLLKERERAEEKVAELETEIDLLKIDIESLESAARGKDVTNKE